MTLLELKNSVRAVLDEASPAQFTDANIVAWINAGERDVAAKTGCLETILDLSTTANSRLVAFTGDKVNDVELTSTKYTKFLPGGETNWQDIDDSVWLDTSSALWYDYTNTLWIPYPDVAKVRVTPHHLGHISKRGETTPEYWFQWGNYIVIEPLPTSVHTLKLYVSSSPTNQMSADGNSPQISYEFHDAIPLYAIAMGFLKARKYQRSALVYGEYISMLQGLINKYIRRRPARIVDIRLPDLVHTKTQVGRK